MVSGGQADSFWRSVRDLPGRIPLRTKLISAVLALVAIALVVISSAGLLILRNDLLAPYDKGLAASFNADNPSNVSSAASLVKNYLIRGQTQTQVGTALDWISGGQVAQVIIPVTAANQGNLGPPSQAGPTMPGPATQLSSSWLVAHAGHIITLPSVSGSGRWRMLMEPQAFGDPVSGATISGTIVVAFDVTSVYHTIGQLAYIDWLVSLAVLCLLGIVVVAVIRRSLRPLVDIEQTAGAIAEGDLSRRVPDRDPRTEVGRLGRSLNIMLSHIETAFRARSRSEAAARRSEEKMRQFVADASHELRTPLTAIRGFAEYYRQRGGIAVGESANGHLTTPDMDRIMRRVEQESVRMGILVEDMLLLARLDQQRPLEAKPVDLLTLAADAVHDARVVAPDRSINLTVSSGAALIVIGDEVRLRQVIGNLMTNALTHTPAGTPVDVLIRPGTVAEGTAAHGVAEPDDPERDELEPDEPEFDEPDPPPARPAQPAAVLEVADHGPGLTREQAEHVFERFYRGDPARSVGGTGLGLAIVAALVAAHGGATWVRSSPGEGATFCIALPLAPEAVRDPDDEDQADLGDENQVNAKADRGVAAGRTPRSARRDLPRPASHGVEVQVVADPAAVVQAGR
jgi:two-component system OmpR family sensor kinase